MKKININDTLYPKTLKSIPNPPLSLYVAGNIDLLNSKSIAIIGSRYASENGKLLAEKFATELSQIGITIISGLALGIDSAAHTSSYNKKGKTIAVLGSGFNNIFPEENTSLFKEIINNDGLIISEYPPNTQVKSNYFIARNRIISGLSLGILVIEAQYRSGTSVTARIAKEQGRPIFTLPHELWDSNGVGTNKLLKNGATLVTDTSDILKSLNLNRFKLLYSDMKKNGSFDKFSNTSIRKLNLQNKKMSNSKKICKQQKIPSLKKVYFTNQKYNKIYKLIESNLIYSSNLNNFTLEHTIPTSVNDISHKTGYSINEIQSILFIRCKIPHHES